MKIIRLLFLIFASHSIVAQVSTSNLPIIIINTRGQAIVDDPKIEVEFKVIYNGEGKINNVNDAPTHYNAFAGIEFRGSSSQQFPKKPYSLELHNAKGENNPIELCGLPKESDWILFASYNEKSLIRNTLSMSFARQLGTYASRTKYVEVIINGNYQGLYVLMEKIKIDKNRLDISKLKETDISGDELTGGYIFKIDKGTGTNYGSFDSKFPPAFGKKLTYYYDTPKTINTTQKNYIRGQIEAWEETINGSNFRDPALGYRKYIDVQSFVKLFLVNEISKNVDGYRISTYMFKDKDSKNGKINAGPAWDYDISFGNADYCDGNKPEGFSYRFNEVCPNDFWLVPNYWAKMITDPYFVGELRNTYFNERKPGGIFDYAKISKDIDAKVLEINDAQKRNFIRWPILGTYVWPSPRPVPSTWEGEITSLKNWISQRLIWLDNNMPKDFVITSSDFAEESLTIKAFPNPFVDKIYLDVFSNVNTEAQIMVYDMYGKELLNKNLVLNQGKNQEVLNFESFSNIQSAYILKLKTKNGEIKMSKIVGGE